MKNTKYWIYVVIGMSISSCAINPERCSPRTVDDFFLATICYLSGDMKMSVQLQRDELARLIREVELSELELYNLELNSAKMANDIELYHAEIEKQRVKLEKIDKDLSEKKVATVAQAAKVKVLKEEVAKLHSEFSTEMARSIAEESELLEIRTLYERRMRVFEALTLDVKEE